VLMPPLEARCRMICRPDTVPIPARASGRWASIEHGRSVSPTALTARSDNRSVEIAPVFLLGSQPADNARDHLRFLTTASF
jgi:hypothetical protein